MPEVRVLRSDELPPGTRALLDTAFAGRFNDDDWQHALGGWHVVVDDDGGQPAAHAAVVERTIDVGGLPIRTGYVESVATHPARQHEGLGTIAMQEIARIIESDFDLGALSTGAHAFYERLGWERWRGPTFVRRGNQVMRSEDEDDGVMVLRTERTRGIDLTAAITCEARQGDDW